jgi:hypothetical protein
MLGVHRLNMSRSTAILSASSPWGSVRSPSPKETLAVVSTPSNKPTLCWDFEVGMVSSLAAGLSSRGTVLMRNEVLEVVVNVAIPLTDFNIMSSTLSCPCNSTSAIAIALHSLLRRSSYGPLFPRLRRPRLACSTVRPRLVIRIVSVASVLQRGRPHLSSMDFSAELQPHPATADDKLE